MAAAGLYDPRFEHDACGVGFVADLSGRGEHDVVARAVRVLCHLEHRGAKGGDPGTGDGAGILTQLPDEFFRAVCGFALPGPGSYAAGLAFISAERTVVSATIERLAAAGGLTVLGWREVPYDVDACGAGARAVLPELAQLFGAGADGEAGARPAGPRGGERRVRPGARADGVLPAQTGRTRGRGVLRQPVRPD